MGKLFDIESPLMSGLNKLADIIILNFLTLICCLPVVTIGASVTAMHYVLLKIVRDEETYIIKGFFKSFKQNFRQATIIWVVELLIAVVLVLDLRILVLGGDRFPAWFPMGLIGSMGLLYILGIMIFPILSKFDNTIIRTVKNSVLMGVMVFPKTILIAICSAIPFAWIYFAIMNENSILGSLSPILILLGISGPGFLCTLLYNKTFKRFEPKVEEKNPDEWSVEVEATDDAGEPGEEFESESEDNIEG